jgi:hypothetical protein
MGTVNQSWVILSIFNFAAVHRLMLESSGSFDFRVFRQAKRQRL